MDALVCVLFLFCSNVLGGSRTGWVPEGAGVSAFLVNPDGHVFLAHNYLDGKYFEDVEEHDLIGYYDGEEWHLYKVTDNIVAQASDPYSLTTSLFIEGEWRKPVWVYQNIYVLPDTLVMQTSVEKDGNYSWGRRFVIAVEFVPRTRCR